MEKIEEHSKFFWYGATSLGKHPFHVEGGLILLCTGGEALISTGIQQYRVVENSSAMFLSGMKFLLLTATDDFTVRMFQFPKKLFEEVVLKLPPAFSQFMNETSVYEHPANAATLKNVRIFMDMAAVIYEERENQYANVMQRNFIQNYMLYVLENVQPFLNQATSKYTVRQRLYHRFVSLLYHHCREHRDIGFYAAKLCISSRYLYDVAVECSPGLTPKQLIDRQLLLEIKTALYSSDLTITEIAYQLHLPDQSYLCRYFKRHAGISPTEYRKQSKSV